VNGGSRGGRGGRTTEIVAGVDANVRSLCGERGYGKEGELVSWGVAGAKRCETCLWGGFKKKRDARETA